MQEEKGMTEVRWLDGITDLLDMGLGGLWEPECCSSWGRKELDTTE